MCSEILRSVKLELVTIKGGKGCGPRFGKLMLKQMTAGQEALNRWTDSTAGFEKKKLTFARIPITHSCRKTKLIIKKQERFLKNIRKNSNKVF